MIRVLLVLLLPVAAAMGQRSLAVKPTRLPLEKHPLRSSLQPSMKDGLVGLFGPGGHHFGLKFFLQG